MTDRRTKAIGFGVVLLVVGLVLVWGGLTPLSQHRDADGYLLSDPLTIDRPTRAVTTTDTELLYGHYDCAAEETIIFDFFSPDDVRIRSRTAGNDEVFMGIAPAQAVDDYLDGVAHDEITDSDCDMDDITSVEYTTHDGDTTPSAPGNQLFWVMSASGTGEQTLDWTVERGAWAVVIMNADGSSGVSADVSFGALAPSSLDVLAWTSVGVGLAALMTAGWLMYLALSRWRPVTTPADGHGAASLRDAEGIEQPSDPPR